ncbi:glutathione S-transferase U10-like [Humulus lupulus]|uniref:glutathione S-transferase U10-like n=1 Tax=Humulus lupulus TaxID=3486 RepID=UPI002B417F18|nr:glutathione S-transferase U10-like [Humulus lupulus]
MAEEDTVTLYGFWASPYAKRVELALKLKGIPYEYVEEDFPNKSSELIRYNPVYKKVPVLVHNGKAISESLVILEYIDETWKTGPKLLPDDPYKRAQVRFWASFLEQLFGSMLTALKSSTGEAQHKAFMEVSHKLELLEEGLKNFYPDCTRIDGASVGLLDLVMVSMFGGKRVQEEVLGINVIDHDKTPLLSAWITALGDIPLVKEALPPHDKLVAFLKYIRENALKSSAP